MDANSTALAGSLFTSLPVSLLDVIHNFFESDFIYSHQTTILASGSLLALSLAYYHNSKKSVNI